jgi:hypothetical protein
MTLTGLLWRTGVCGRITPREAAAMDSRIMQDAISQGRSDWAEHIRECTKTDCDLSGAIEVALRKGDVAQWLLDRSRKRAYENISPWWERWIFKLFNIPEK